MAGKKGQFIDDVQIVAFADKGECIAKTPDGEVILIREGVPGDIAKVQLKRKRKGLWTGIVVATQQPSTDRIQERCSHFWDCGGCKWQHIDYSAQLRHKMITVENAVQRIAKWEPENWLPPIGAKRLYYYRNKIEFSFSQNAWISRAMASTDLSVDRPSGALGLHPPRFFDKVVDLQHCYLQDDLSNHIRNYLRQLTIAKGYAYYEPNTHQGWLRSVILRHNVRGEWMLILVMAHEDVENRTYILNALWETFPQIVSLQYCINKKHNDTLGDQDILHYRGDPYLQEYLDHVRYQLGPKSFFQTNSHQARVLYRKVKEACSLNGDEIVYDMYTGVGSIALYLADSCKTVVGVEEVPEAIDYARINATINGYTNAHFEVGDVRVMFNDALVEQYGKPDVLVVDPPRAGLHADVCATILKFSPRKIVYVSCNPATQARDLALLKDAYTFQQIQAVDMFPQTSHIESIAVLNRKT